MHVRASSRKKSERETNPAVLRQAVMKIIDRRVIAQGEIDFPCIPSLAETYVTKVTNLWAGLGRSLSKQETAVLRDGVDRALVAGYGASPYARMVVTYVAQPPPGWGVATNPLVR
jgi:hypothetical protein